MNEKIIINKDIERLYLFAAELIEKSINEVLRKKGSANFAVCGGRSVAGIFDNLLKCKINWNKVHIFMADERLVPVDSPESNFLIVKKHLTDYLISNKKIKPDNVHPFIFNPNARDKGILDYSKELSKFGSCYDVILLSSGEDGHIGGLYPNHHSIKDDSPDYIIMDDSPKPPAERMSSSKKLLLSATYCILMFVGESKKEALSRFFDSGSVEEVPCRLVKKIQNHYILTNQTID